MSENVQVVEIGEDNSLVPNLTISVDNEEGEADLPEVEYEMAQEAEDLNDTKVTRHLNSFSRKVMYMFRFKTQLQYIKIKEGFISPKIFI